MLSHKKISVLMSLYNKENTTFFDLCLDSISMQSRKPDQVVIVLDGYVRHELIELIEKYSKQLSITTVELPSNLGLGVALNTGLKHCDAELIARLDTDDICMPNRLEIQEKYIIENDIDILGSSAFVIDCTGNVIGERKNPSSHQNIVKKLWCNPFIHPSVMYKKSAIEKLGGYNSSLRRRQDYELWFRASQLNLKFANVPDKLIKYRFDKHTLSKQSPRLAWQQGVIGFKGCQSCNLGIIKSLLCFFPFLRALFPVSIQIKIINAIKCFDPRRW